MNHLLTYGDLEMCDLNDEDASVVSMLHGVSCKTCLRLAVALGEAAAERLREMRGPLPWRVHQACGSSIIETASPSGGTPIYECLSCGCVHQSETYYPKAAP